MPLKELTWNCVKPFYRIIKETFRFKYVSNVEEVHKELKNLNRNKSAGIDNLPPNLLRDCIEVISPHLLHFINLSLSRDIFLAVYHKGQFWARFSFLYFNDFDKCLKKSKTYMFADDTVVYCANKDPNQIDRETLPKF